MARIIPNGIIIISSSIPNIGIKPGIKSIGLTEYIRISSKNAFLYHFKPLYICKINNSYLFFSSLAFNFRHFIINNSIYYYTHRLIRCIRQRLFVSAPASHLLYFPLEHEKYPLHLFFHTTIQVSAVLALLHQVQQR